MNKTELFNAFDGKISKTAIVPTGGEPGTYLVRGKFAEIEPLDDGTFDVWITDTSSPVATLGTRKVNNILSAAQSALQIDAVRRYDGEAWFAIARPAMLLSMLSTLGIRRARRMSPEAKKAAAARLAKVRTAEPLSLTVTA